MLGPALFAFQVLVAGEDCPAAADVAARVRTILHLAPEQDLSEGFVVERREAGLHVELRSADSTLIGQRTLPTEGSCDELAQAAAVVLSAWLSDVHPDFAGALPPPTPDPPAAVPPAPPAPTPTPASRPAPQAAPRPVRSPSPWQHRFELALGAGADIASAGVTFAGVLGLGYVPTDHGFGLSGIAIASTSRQASLGPGLVDWRRWPVGLGPSFRIGTRSVVWDFNAGPVLGWLRLVGSNFDRPSSEDGIEWGGFLNARLSSRGRHWGVFGLADAQFFPGDSRARASGADGAWSAPLPTFSVNLAIGIWLSP